jgi:hypothetical protein
MIRMIAASAFLSLTLSALPAYAAGDTTAAVTPAVPAKISQSLSRPAALPALYVSYAALQAFDVYSTRQALGRGAREANPLMEGVVGNTDAFVAVKAAVAVSTFVAAERLWKTNKTAAIAVMVASNGVAAVVAARNARTLRQLR